MAWAEFFYSANIPFAAAWSVSFKKAVKMISEMRSSYLPPSYHDIRKRLLNETKHKIKAQIAERTKMFIRTYGAMLAEDGWSSVNNHPLFNMMSVSPAGEEFLGAIDTSGHMKDAIYIANVIKRYLIEVGPENVVQVCTGQGHGQGVGIGTGSRAGTGGGRGSRSGTGRGRGSHVGTGSGSRAGTGTGTGTGKSVGLPKKKCVSEVA
jgi:hypothetical protein